MLRIQTTLSFVLRLAGSVIGLGLVTAACSSSSAGVTNDSSCDAFENAMLDLSVKCGLIHGISADQRAASVSRYRSFCASSLAAPGTSLSASYLQACATAIGSSTSCNAAIPQCVTAAGSEANGTACGDDDQCQSTYCAIAASSENDAGATTAITACGKCAPSIADGAPCGAADTCVEGDQCLSGVCGKQTSSSGGTGPIGSACQQDADCATPNHCDFTQGVCAAPGTAGSSCFVAGDCATGFICTAGQQCEAPVASGGNCVGGDCASGLGCDATTHKCASITFAAAGAPCDGDGVLCDRGACAIAVSSGSSGACPTILADGAACDATNYTAVCDIFAECVSGTCQVSNPASCK